MSKYCIYTSIGAEELYFIQNSIDYMMAIKILKESGCDISNMPTVYMDGFQNDLYYSILQCIHGMILDPSDGIELVIKGRADKDTAKKLEELIVNSQEDAIKDSIIIKNLNEDNLQMMVNIDNLDMWQPSLHILAKFVVKVNNILKEGKSCKPIS